MKDTDIMPFGKEHRGKKIGNVPAKFLLWAYDQDWIDKYPDVKEYIKENMDVLTKEKNQHSQHKKKKY